MALSVKKFINDLTCPEPSEQVNVMYHPTSSSVLCDGGGTPTAIFSNNSSLGTIAANGGSGSGAGAGSSAYAAGPDTCSEGMDVVFVVDYTGSMGGAIDGVKTGISNIVSTIDSESGGNYRLGLVLFDGGRSNYNTSNFYTSLPAGQKINELSGAVLITCAEMMGAVGNSSSFTTALNSINTTDMPIGDSKEHGLRAISEVVNNQFAGSFRSDMQKLIILITDDGPEQNAIYAVTLANDLENEGIQVLYQTSQSDPGDSRYNTLVESTQPEGAANYGLNFNSSWTSSLTSAISTLCDNTYLYSCDEIANGWYMEPGDSVAYNWNGSVWTSTTCSYTVKVNLAKAANSGTWNIKPIPQTHPNYFDANTFIFTGNYSTSNSYGSTGTLTWELDNTTDYTVEDITGVVESTQSGTAGYFQTSTDNGVGHSGTDAGLAANEFSIAGPMLEDAEYTITLSAKTKANTYNMKVIVIADEPDTLDADDNTQSPSGAIDITGTDPASFWLNAASSYTTKTGATFYTFSGVTGSTHNFELALAPVPSDYSIDVTGYTDTYSNTASQNAIGPNIVVNDTSVTGSFTMPSGGGIAEIFLEGQVNQPSYEFDLSVTDSIAGISVLTADQTQSFTGYTGDTFVWAADLVIGTDYDGFTINYGTSAANPSTYVSIGSGAGAGHDIHGEVTMPSGGGSSTVTVAGTSTESEYDFELTFTDDFSGEETYGGPITVTGNAGELITTTRQLSGTDSDITYSISTVTSDSTDAVVTKSGTTLTIKTTMPSGGGSATIDVAGSSSVNSYSYTVRFEIPAKFQSIYYGWKNEADENIQTGVTYVDVPVSGNAGDVISIVAPVALVTVQDYQRVTPTTSSRPLNAEITNEGGTNGSFTGGSNTIQHAYTPSCTLTMPSGGGSVTIPTYMTTSEKSHAFSLVVSTDSGSSGVTATSQACSTDPTGVSRGSIIAGTQVIAFGGKTGSTFNTIQVPVRPNNTTDYDNEIDSFTVAPLAAAAATTVVERNNYCGSNVEYADIDFEMPSLDPRFGLTINSGTVTVNDTVTAISRAFTLNYTDSISNAGPARANDTFNGGVGTTHNYSIAYSASSGYTLALSGATDDSSAVTVARSGNTVSGVVTMPSGGGSATVTATGTSTQNKHRYTVTLSEAISNAAIVGGNAQGRKTLTVDLVPGATHTFTEAISISSGYYWSSGPSITDNQTHATSSVNSSGVISITVTGGSSARSADVTVTGGTSVIQRTLTVKYRDKNAGMEANVTSGSGAGYTTWTQDTFTGAPGSTGSKTLYYMPNSGYVASSIGSISSSNNIYASGATDNIAANAGEEWTLSYAIPNANTTVTITVDGTAVPATAATAATTLATAATTLATRATAATTTPTQATAATTQATKATIATTKATAATTRATFATVEPTQDAYYYYQVSDCEGQIWNAKATYTAARFTNHEAGIVPVGFNGSIATITRLLISAEDDGIVWLMRATNETCEGGGGPDPDPISGGGGGGGSDDELSEPGGREPMDEPR